MPPEGLESSVDGLGRPVRAVGVVEEREDVRHAAFEGASERDESGASGRRSPDSEGFDELGHHAPSCVLASWRPLCERCFFRSVGSGFSAGCAVSAAACLRCVGYLVMRACSLR